MPAKEKPRVSRGDDFFFQVVVKCKGEICLAAAEVDDAQGAAGRQIFKNVVDNLKIPVYLAEFAVGTWKDLSVPAHYTQLYEKVAWNAVGDNIIFGFVVRKDRHTRRHGNRFF